MYCPSCRAEYMEGITECPDCGEVLVNELPPRETAASRPKLKTLTLLVIAATVYMFVIRTIGTIFPSLFASLALARVTTVLNLISSLALLFFFIFMLREYAIDNRVDLKGAATYGIAGAFVALILDSKSLFTVFSPHFVPGTAGSRYLDAILPAAGGILIMLFFIFFYRFIDKPALKRISLLAVTASIIAAITNLFTLANYVLSGRFRWLSDFAVENIIVFLPIYVFISVAYFMFFLAFYRELQ